MTQKERVIWCLVPFLLLFLFAIHISVLEMDKERGTKRLTIKVMDWEMKSHNPLHGWMFTAWHATKGSSFLDRRFLGMLGLLGCVFHGRRRHLILVRKSACKPRRRPQRSESERPEERNVFVYLQLSQRWSSERPAVNLYYGVFMK